MQQYFFSNQTIKGRVWSLGLSIQQTLKGLYLGKHQKFSFGFSFRIYHQDGRSAKYLYELIWRLRPGSGSVHNWIFLSFLAQGRSTSK